MNLFSLAYDSLVITQSFPSSIFIWNQSQSIKLMLPSAPSSKWTGKGCPWKIIVLHLMPQTYGQNNLRNMIFNTSTLWDLKKIAIILQMTLSRKFQDRPNQDYKNAVLSISFQAWFSVMPSLVSMISIILFIGQIEMCLFKCLKNFARSSHVDHFELCHFIYKSVSTSLIAIKLWKKSCLTLHSQHCACWWPSTGRC